MTDKAALRKEKLALRRSLSDEERNTMSQIICDRFLELDVYKNAKTILLYKAYNNEVDTDPIFERAIADGKEIAYPVSKISNGEPVMDFYIVDDHSKLCSGYMGIPEPDTGAGLKLFEGSANICVSPGAVFDRKCNRIGYGKAFYDRYLRQNRPGLVIGLAYDIQMADDFEPGENDVAVDIVITDKETYFK